MRTAEGAGGSWFQLLLRTSPARGRTGVFGRAFRRSARERSRGDFEGQWAAAVLRAMSPASLLSRATLATNPMSTPPQTPDPLHRLLDRWGEATPPQPAPLTAEVWRQIAREKAPAAAPGWRERINTIFARPSFAAAFVAACVLLGLFLAEVRTSRRQAEYGAQLAQGYLRLIDPLLAAGAESDAAPETTKP